VTRYAESNVLSVQQRTDLLIPLADALGTWLALYNDSVTMWAEGARKGIISYDEELTKGNLARFDKLAFDLNEIRRMLTAIERVAIIPTPEPFVPTPITPTEEVVPDSIEVLRNEVARIIAASQGVEPPPPAWAVAVSVAIPLLGVIDLIGKKAFGTTAEQAAAGAKTGALAFITQMYGATTFAAFMYEEAVQSIGMSGWVAYNAKQYAIALDAFMAQEALITEAVTVLEEWRPLMPLTYPGFRAFFDTSGQANGLWLGIVRDAMQKAGIPAPPILAVLTKPAGAALFIDDKDTLTLSPETFRQLAPGVHTVTAIIPATATKAEMGASQEITLVAGKRREISLVLTTLEEAEAAAPPPTAPATLRVSSSPSEGAIFMDGSDTGLLTPETFKQLAPGAHTITVVVPPRGGWPERRATVTLTLAPGQKRELTLSPTIP